ncbi:MAG: hypothetical protein NTY77_17915 [Elusimicrobia bacterium]|nr:hypothetical protein [Elusimicrobiota bacterium]
MVKCPACGFDSPDSARWCDLCKEPFRKARPEAAPAAKADPEGARKAPEPGMGIPPEFLTLDTGGKVPAAPRWFRYAAWCSLVAWLIVVMVLMKVYMARHRAQLQDQPSEQSAQPR